MSNPSPSSGPWQLVIRFLLIGTSVFALYANAFSVLAPNYNRMVHWGLLGLLFAAMISGYLISTADGSGIDVFGLFEVPSVTGRQNGLEDSAGLVHYWSTWALVVLAGLHGLAALKHHFIDRDATLKRMLRP